MVTNYQIKKVFYRDNKGIKNCNRRLRMLYHEMYCIDRYFPPVDTGSSKQHLMLDKAGAKAIGISPFYKLNKPVLRHEHHRLVTEFNIRGWEKGLGWAKLEHKIADQVADLYYPRKKMAVEIDTGSESRKTLKGKIKGYNRTTDLNYLIFVTTGGQSRIDLWEDKIRSDIKFAGCQFKDVDELLNIIK
nr:replication-relaxation family protein [Natroniella acetigena]